MKANLWILALLVLAVGCGKETIEHPDCENIKTGIIENNLSLVKTEIEKLTVDLKPTLEGEDLIGHERNIHTLVERLNSHCSLIHAELNCYACLYSHPAQSIIAIEFEEAGTTYASSIRILTPDDDILRFAGLGEVD